MVILVMTGHGVCRPIVAEENADLGVPVLYTRPHDIHLSHPEVCLQSEDDAVCRSIPSWIEARPAGEAIRPLPPRGTTT